MTDKLDLTQPPSKPTNANDAYLVDVTQREAMKESITGHFKAILTELGIDLVNDPNSKDTPRRVAKMLVDELFVGRFIEPPPFTEFPNEKGVDQLIVTGPLTVKSTCSHHWQAIVGKAWIGYLPDKKVLGLSKFPRVLDWFCRRPQIQEELTAQVADFLEERLKPRGLGVYISAQHFCQSHRGVNETPDALMQTYVLRGVLRDNPSTKEEFLNAISRNHN